MTGSRKQFHRYILIAAVLAIAGLVILGIRWTYYYDLNDDMLMENILSGKYTGVPESRNIQNLYPFSLLMSLLYRIGFDADGAGHGFGLPALDWYGLTLLALIAICYGMTILRVMRRAGQHRHVAEVLGGSDDESAPGSVAEDADNAALPAESVNERRIRHALQLIGILGITLLYGAVLLYHLIYVQYTVVVGMMGATAAFLILTSDDKDTVRSFLRENIPSFVLIFLGYAIRSEMMMFMLPFASLTVLFRVLPCRDLRQIAARIAASLAVLLIGVGVIYGIDAAAYASPTWKEFRAVFNARTQLYDFESIPPYEGNEDFYESIGLDESEAQLLVNYNFGIDADIDSTVLQQVADYAAQLRKTKTPVKSKIQAALWVYRHQKLFDSSEMPYNMISFVLYGLVVITAVFDILCAAAESRSQKNKLVRAGAMILQAGMIFIVRSILWLYLLYSDRPVARLTHSMYYAEALLLLVILFYKRRLDATASLRAAFVACVFLYAAGVQTTLADNEVARRAVNNAAFSDFVSYAQEHPDSFYVVDVYSTVDFSEEMFDNYKVTAPNWDLCGGWASKSPLESDKLASYGIDSIEEGLVSGGSVYFAARAEYDTDWIVRYYESRGVKVVVNRVDMIGDYWAIYSVDTWDL